MTPPRPFDLCLVGAGKAGTGVALALKAAGHRVAGVASRTPASAAAAAERVGAAAVAVDHLPPCDVVLLGVPDAAVRPVAAALAPGLRPGTVVWHLAGSLGVDALPPAVRRCALHPVQAFPAPDVPSRLPGSSWGLTCDGDLREWATAVVTDDLRGHVVDVSEEDRPVWHAAAVTTANGITALVSLAETLLGSIGVEAPGPVLAPLAAAAVESSTARGASASLTGPAVRGEWETVAAHVQALEANAPALLEPYREATRLIFRAADRAGKVTPEARASAAALLGGGE
ncbi:MAG TPA: DUF2520 domain-containing protein [Actinomycetota bacterium]|nr:DUF2520 domain-containing protein [Actinomycetota bacterium]